MKKAFQTYILQRYLADDKLNEFLEEYNSNRKGTGSEKRTVSELDRIIYREYQRGSLVQHLSIKFGRSYWWIYKAINLAAKEAEENNANNQEQQG